MKILTRLLCVRVLAGCAAKAPEGSFVQSDDGRRRDARGGAREARALEVRSDRIVRVTAVADENLDLPAEPHGGRLAAAAARRSR